MRTAIAAVAILACVAPASAAEALRVPSAYIEYVESYGDVYNGVTSDDAENLAGSYLAKARLEWGHYSAAVRFRRDATLTQANTVVAGGPGTTLSFPKAQIAVPQFTAVDAEFEARLEYQPAQFPVSLGLAYSKQTNSYGFPALHAIGIGAELQANPHHLFSPYASFFFFPNQAGTYALADPNNPNSGTFPAAYRVNELDVGVSVALPKTAVALVLGYSQTTNVSKLSSFNFVRAVPYVGVGYRLK